MRKFVCGLLTLILMMNVILITPVKASDEYVEVNLPIGGTLHIKEGVNTTIKTSGGYVDMYTRGKWSADVDIERRYDDGEKIIYETYIAKSENSNAKIYLPESVIEQTEILLTPLIQNVVIKPGEFYSYENKGTNYACPIVYYGAYIDLNWPLDIIQYSSKGEVSGVYKSNNSERRGPQLSAGEKILFGNSGDKDVTLKFIAINPDEIKPFNGPLFQAYDLKPGETCTIYNENFIKDTNEHLKFSAFESKGEEDFGNALQSIGYDSDGKIIGYGSGEKIVSGLKTEWVNKGRYARRFYLSLDFKGKIEFSKGSKDLVYKVMLNPGESLYYKATEQEKIVTRYSLPSDCDILYYNSNNNYTFNSNSPNQYIGDIRGFEINNTTDAVKIVEIPYVGKENYTKDYSEIVDKIELVPGATYNINGNPKEEIKGISLKSNYISVDFATYTVDYNYMGNGFPGSSYDVFDLRYKLRFNGEENAIIKVRKGDKRFFTREEDLDFSGNVDIMDLAIMSLRYNYSPNEASLSDLYLCNV
ncbi:MAG: hypothetical protein ACRC2K_03440, partial [Clostridium sp.]